MTILDLNPRLAAERLKRDAARAPFSAAGTTRQMAATLRLSLLPMMIGYVVVGEFTRFMAASMGSQPPRIRAGRDLGG